ncbi:MAG TPA: sigma-70 family RNA polymerase sigma factor [Stellaceae bacterium]|nr:sigma-70 family RNA polymerase sigma factor [Stellaceae bacterium]
MRRSKAAPARSDSFTAAILPQLDAAYNLARWLMRDATAAEDVVQEAMLRALTYFPSFRSGNARGWLLQIVRNTAYDALKLDRSARFVPLAGTAAEGDEESGIDLPSDADDPEVTLIKSRDQHWLHEVLGGLPVELRETLVLRELEELSYKEIAEVTQTPIGTVMSRLWRARRALMQAVADQERSHA